MAKICLLRHGETDWNIERRMQGRENIELNETGRMQAVKSGLFLKEFDVEAIVTSPLQRAKETTEIISKILNISSILEMDEFLERDFGAASGLTRQEAKELFPDGNILNIEDVDMLTQRVFNGLNIILERFENKNILVITHGAVINSILYRISDGKMGTTKPDNGCINIINHTQGKWKIEICNSTLHLK